MVAEAVGAHYRNKLRTGQVLTLQACDDGVIEHRVRAGHCSDNEETTTRGQIGRDFVAS